MPNGISGFKDEFINKLSEAYPEKAVFLMGMDFELMYLIEFIKENNLTPETFVPLEFKKYIDSQPTFYQYHGVQTIAITNPIAGMIFYDTSTKTLKIYDGGSWVDVIQ